MALEKQDYFIDFHPEAEIVSQKINTRFMPRLSYASRKELLEMLDYPGFNPNEEIMKFIDALESTVI